MATQVVQSQNSNANNNSGGPGAISTNPEADPTNPDHVHGPGPTYANAVLKLKHTDCNKENISDSVVRPRININKNLKDNNKERTKSNQNAAVVAVDDINNTNITQDDGEHFTTVTSHSRKERKHEKTKRDRNHSSQHHHHHPQQQQQQQLQQQPQKNTVVVNGAAPPHQQPQQSQQQQQQHTAISNKDKESSKVEAQQDKDSHSDSGNGERKVFVEAPIPKVNPWQVNKNAAQVLQSQPPPPLPPPVHQPPKQDKRVLQPQRQDVNMSGTFFFVFFCYFYPIIYHTFTGNNQPSVVRAPKDRRKFNQKVS